MSQPLTHYLPNRFVEAIVRCACYKYEELKTKDGWDGEESVGERLKRIMIDDVLVNACSVDVDVFRDRMEGDQVQNVFAKHKHNLKRVFESYAADDVGSDETMACADTMNVGELVTFGRAFTLIGGPPLLSERAVKTLFAYVQQEDPDGEDENGEALIDDNSEMVLGEFKEMLAAVGSQFYPDPYNVFEMKVAIFLKKNIVMLALTMDRFRKLGAPPKGLKPLLAEGESRPGSAKA